MTQKKNETLKDRWKKVCLGLGCKDSVIIKSSWDTLNESYSDPRRKYHNWSHIEYCLQFLLPDDNLVPFALFFHDVDLKSEFTSADIAYGQLLEIVGSSHRFLLSELYSVRNMITATETPWDASTRHARVQTINANIVRDIDCAILAENPSSYDKYCSAVEQEAEEFGISKLQFLIQRLDILYHFTQLPNIYTPGSIGGLFDTSMELAARNNIRREMARIRQRLETGYETGEI